MGDSEARREEEEAAARPPVLFVLSTFIPPLAPPLPLTYALFVCTAGGAGVPLSPPVPLAAATAFALAPCCVTSQMSVPHPFLTRSNPTAI